MYASAAKANLHFLPELYNLYIMNLIVRVAVQMLGAA